MMFYKWEWPGSNKKFRSQKKSGKGRMGRRKAPGRWEGTHCHALRPRDWGKTKVNVRVVWQALKCMLSAKYVQNSLTVVDSWAGANLDINDNGRWASAHIPAIRRENVEGVSCAAARRKEIQSFPKKMNWHQKFATPDGTPAPVPSKVEGWNNAWIEKKERIRNSEFRAREFFKESLKWKWSHDLKGPLKLPQSDDMKGFREEEFDELLSQLDALEERSAMPGGGLIQDKADITRHGLRQLQVALEEGAAGSKKKEAAAWAQKPQAAAEALAPRRPFPCLTAAFRGDASRQRRVTQLGSASRFCGKVVKPNMVGKMGGSQKLFEERQKRIKEKLGYDVDGTAEHSELEASQLELAGIDKEAQAYWKMVVHLGSWREQPPRPRLSSEHPPRSQAPLRVPRGCEDGVVPVQGSEPHPSPREEEPSGSVAQAAADGRAFGFQRR
eukprot:g30860.t1